MNLAQRPDTAPWRTVALAWQQATREEGSLGHMIALETGKIPQEGMAECRYATSAFSQSASRVSSTVLRSPWSVRTALWSRNAALAANRILKGALAAFADATKGPICVINVGHGVAAYPVAGISHSSIAIWGADRRSVVRAHTDLARRARNKVGKATAGERHGYASRRRGLALSNSERISISVHLRRSTHRKHPCLEPAPATMRTL